MSNYIGPTVYEQAEARYRRRKWQIMRLHQEQERDKKLMEEYKDSTMLEAERVATVAEPFQSKQLPVE